MYEKKSRFCLICGYFTREIPFYGGLKECLDHYHMVYMNTLPG